MVGLGNPGRRYDDTRHNLGFAVIERLVARFDLPRPRERFNGRLWEGRAGIDGPRIALLEPLTFMNDAGRSVGPARGSYRLELDRVLVVHDEIDLPFGEVRTRVGGGLAGHNGLKSLRRELGSPEFGRVRGGVGRPPSTDPETVAAYVLAPFSEPPEQVDALLERATDAAVDVILAR